MSSCNSSRCCCQLLRQQRSFTFRGSRRKKTLPRLNFRDHLMIDDSRPPVCLWFVHLPTSKTSEGSFFCLKINAAPHCRLPARVSSPAEPISWRIGGPRLGPVLHILHVCICILCLRFKSTALFPPMGALSSTNLAFLSFHSVPKSEMKSLYKYLAFILCKHPFQSCSNKPPTSSAKTN